VLKRRIASLTCTFIRTQLVQQCVRRDNTCQTTYHEKACVNMRIPDLYDQSEHVQSAVQKWTDFVIQTHDTSWVGRG
jgi:hypothetical protein